MTMIKIIHLLGVLVLLMALPLKAEIVIIGNINSPINNLTKQQVQEIYMGRSRELPDGSYVLPFEYPELRNHFYTQLTGRPIEQVNAYWARIMFSGQAVQPHKIQDEQALIKIVVDNRSALAYVDKKSVSSKQVKVLFTLE